MVGAARIGELGLEALRLRPGLLELRLRLLGGGASLGQLGLVALT